MKEPNHERPESSENAPRTGHESRDSIQGPWGPRTPYVGDWPARVDERTVEAPEKWVQSACVLCSNGCALDIGVKEGRIVGVRGRAADRINKGRLGPKGLHGWEANGSGDRLTRPLIRRNGRFVAASWDEAMELVVARVREVLADTGGNGIGFYSSGQLLLEEYYALAVIGRAGIGTPHMDGNTRLCTATAAEALMVSFGSDGQPASYSDFDTTDAIFLAGHNAASQQTVLWSRILDRRRGPRPPALVVMDPRRTETAQEADVHLAPRLGTNVAVLNGLLRWVIEHHADEEFIRQHTEGFEKLRETVSRYTPERVVEVSGVPAEALLKAARILGEAPSLVSTVLQGVYQSMQATAAAIQVNNLQLVRGMIGKPGCGVFQMNGQPTAQNTRETGCDGSLPGFRKWDAEEHVREVARLWNVEPEQIPSWGPPTHAMQMFRWAEEGSIRLLWVIATNPAVSMPELARIRTTLGGRRLFLVVQDAFLTETAELADVVLPAAIWAEKTGTFTNTDRTVHLALEAVAPPGEARSDLEIFLDFARRMRFLDKAGAPLIKWTKPEEVFEAWKQCSKGRPCDYSGMTYEKLARGSIQWPCNERFPDGKERLYDDLRFETPSGKAILRAAEWEPPREQPGGDYPLWLTTGRVLFHFHTRTKTGRARALQDAAPDVFVQISTEDAQSLGIEQGDAVEIASRRGRIRARARLGGIEPGVVFVPFHYGSWDDGTRRRAANELTLTAWDPESKQPSLKYAAVSVKKVAHLEESPIRFVEETVKSRLDLAAANLAGALRALAARRHVAAHLGRLEASEEQLCRAFEKVAARHEKDFEVADSCRTFGRWCDEDREALELLIARHGAKRVLEAARFLGPRGGSYGLLLDLHDLAVLAHETHLQELALEKAARALRDGSFVALLARIGARTDRELAWLQKTIAETAAQVLDVPA